MTNFYLPRLTRILLPTALVAFAFLLTGCGTKADDPAASPSPAANAGASANPDTSAASPHVGTPVGQPGMAGVPK